MGWLVIKALILTLIVGVIGIISKSRMNIWWYAIIFVLMLLSQWAFSNELQADEWNYEYTITEDAEKDIAEVTSWIEATSLLKRLSPVQQAEFVERIKFHKENALRTFNDAKARCWYLPNLTDRENARYCFTALIAGMAPLPPQGRLVAIIIATLSQYGLDCIEEWNYIHNKLYWSQYHYEMAEFYEDLLRKDV